MADLLGGSLTIRNITRADLFDSKTNAAHHHEEVSGEDGENNGSRMVTSTQPHAGKSKVATTTQKMSILFNQSEYIKVGYFGKFEFVDSQRAHCETFDGDK